MRSILAVFKREVALYFRSPIAYAIPFALTLFFGLLFNDTVTRNNQNAPADVIMTFIPGLFTFLLFLIAPLLTMRLLAEETREGTLEILMTLPMKEWHFIVGKFLAAWLYYTVLLALTLVYAGILWRIGVPDAGIAFGAYFGAWLYGGAVLAMTLIWSAVTEDQIVAAFLGAATILVLWLADIAAAWFANLSNTGEQNSVVAEVIRELGLRAHYTFTMAQGIIRAEDILYFIFMMIAGLFITTRIVEVRRWRS
ncbi:MAG: hypothetical protein D6737_05670 [Chloroflexi bacterium]|nr:MAG: hypothetical protein D6737_05670 [Chloroflexota bacterium]